MLLAVSLFSTVACLLVISTFREKPKEDLWTIKSTQTDSENHELPLIDQMKLCWKCKKYVFTGLGTSGVIIHFYVFTTLVGQLVAPFGLTEQKFVVDIGVVVMFVGVFGGIVASHILTKYPEKMMMAAYTITLTSIATLAYFFIADRLADKD